VPPYSSLDGGRRGSSARFWPHSWRVPASGCSSSARGRSCSCALVLVRPPAGTPQGAAPRGCFGLHRLCTMEWSQSGGGETGGGAWGRQVPGLGSQGPYGLPRGSLPAPSQVAASEFGRNGVGVGLGGGGVESLLPVCDPGVLAEPTQQPRVLPAPHAPCRREGNRKVVGQLSPRRRR